MVLIKKKRVREQVEVHAPLKTFLHFKHLDYSKCPQFPGDEEFLGKDSHSAALSNMPPLVLSNPSFKDIPFSEYVFFSMTLGGALSREKARVRSFRTKNSHQTNGIGKLGKRTGQSKTKICPLSWAFA